MFTRTSPKFLCLALLIAAQLLLGMCVGSRWLPEEVLTSEDVAARTPLEEGSGKVPSSSSANDLLATPRLASGRAQVRALPDQGTRPFVVLKWPKPSPIDARQAAAFAATSRPLLSPGTTTILPLLC